MAMGSEERRAKSDYERTVKNYLVLAARTKQMSNNIARAVDTDRTPQVLAHLWHELDQTFLTATETAYQALDLARVYFAVAGPLLGRQRRLQNELTKWEREIDFLRTARNLHRDISGQS